MPAKCTNKFAYVVSEQLVNVSTSASVEIRMWYVKCYSSQSALSSCFCRLSSAIFLSTRPSSSPLFHPFLHQEIWFARSEIQLQSTLSRVWQLSFSKLLAFIVTSRCFHKMSSLCFGKNWRVSSHFRTFVGLASEQLSAFFLLLKTRGFCNLL